MVSILLSNPSSLVDAYVKRIGYPVREIPWITFDNLYFVKYITFTDGLSGSAG